MLSKGGGLRISRSIGYDVHKARGSYVPPEVARQCSESSETVCFVIPAPGKWPHSGRIDYKISVRIYLSIGLPWHVLLFSESPFTV